VKEWTISILLTGNNISIAVTQNSTGVWLYWVAQQRWVMVWLLCSEFNVLGWRVTRYLTYWLDVEKYIGSAWVKWFPRSQNTDPGKGDKKHWVVSVCQALHVLPHLIPKPAGALYIKRHSQRSTKAQEDMKIIQVHICVQKHSNNWTANPSWCHSPRPPHHLP
jgi:hypothetical protein